MKLNMSRLLKFLDESLEKIHSLKNHKEEKQAKEINKKVVKNMRHEKYKYKM